MKSRGLTREEFDAAVKKLKRSGKRRCYAAGCRKMCDSFPALILDPGGVTIPLFLCADHGKIVISETR